jgi:hypothetical protein
MHHIIAYIHRFPESLRYIAAAICMGLLIGLFVLVAPQILERNLSNLNNNTVETAAVAATMIHPPTPLTVVANAFAPLAYMAPVVLRSLGDFVITSVSIVGNVMWEQMSFAARVMF